MEADSSEIIQVSIHARVNWQHIHPDWFIVGYFYKDMIID